VSPGPKDLMDAVLALSPDIRYVTVAREGELTMRERGRIDCGGLEYVVIRYGNFYQVVRPIPGGRLSVAVEPHGDPLAVAAAVGGPLQGLLGGRGSEGGR